MSTTHGIYSSVSMNSLRMPLHVSLRWDCDGRGAGEENTIPKCHCVKGVLLPFRMKVGRFYPLGPASTLISLQCGREGDVYFLCLHPRPSLSTSRDQGIEHPCSTTCIFSLNKGETQIYATCIRRTHQ